MDGTILVQGRELSLADIQGIRDLIAARPKGTRWKLSRELCEQWGWRTLTGQLKDMSCLMDPAMACVIPIISGN